MTTILVEENLNLNNNTFKTKKDLFLYLLDEYEDILIGNEMSDILKNSKDEDYIDYENFILSYK